MKTTFTGNHTNSLGAASEAWDMDSGNEVVTLALAPEGGNLTLPIGNALLKADFSRTGDNLHIHLQDSAHYVLPGYYGQETQPDLLSETGKKLSASVVNRLVGAENPGEYAGPANGAQPIGIVEKLQGEVTVKHADGSESQLKQGDPVYQDDVIATGAGGDIGIKFVDNSVFTLGSDARMTLDSMVYDPETGEGKSDVTVIEGMFKFVSGDIAANNPGDMQVHTPVATIGIRGTTGGGQVYGEGQENTFFLEPNADGTVGWFDIKTDAGTQPLNQPNTIVTVNSITQAPPPPMAVNPQVIKQQFNEVIQFAPQAKYDQRPEAQNEANEQNAQQQAAANEQPAADQQQAATGGNVFAELMEAVKVASLGSISNALYQVGGQYRRSM